MAEHIPLIGRIALENNLITNEQLRYVLETLKDIKASGGHSTVEDLLLEQGHMDTDTMAKLLATTVRRIDKKIGEIAVNDGFITREHLEDALNTQAETFKNGGLLQLSDILLDAGLIDENRKQLLFDRLQEHEEPIFDSDAKNVKDKSAIFNSIMKLDKEFCEIAITRGVISTETANKALKKQAEIYKLKEFCILVYEIFLKWDSVSPAEVNSILAQQNRRTLKDSGTLKGHKAAPPSVHQTDAPPANKRKSPEIHLSDDGMKAEFVMPDTFSGPVDIDLIKRMITDAGIRYGIISDEEIQESIDAYTGEGFRFTLAEGTPSKKPKDAEISLFFQKDYLNPGKITEEGTIDFKDRGDVPYVNKGDLLAKKTTAEKGVPGKDIFGETTDMDEANDISFSSGPGTKFSEDQLQIVADIEGQPSITIHGEVSVFDELKIKGDVDFNTGNIVFGGSIIVTGAVKEGFSVSGGSLRAAEIIGGNVDVSGNVEVSGGIIDSVISAGGTVQAMYLSGSSVAAYSDVVIRKEILDSRIITSGACANDKTIIISSSVSAKKGIEASRIGTEVSKPSILRAGVEDHTEHQVSIIKSLLEQKKAHLQANQKQMEALETKLKKSQAIIAEPVKTQETFKTTKAKVLKRLDVYKHMGILSEKDSNTFFKLESALADLNTIINNAEDEIRANLKHQVALTDEILRFRGYCEKAIWEINEANKKIKEIRSWAKNNKPTPSVKAIKEICAKTSFSGPNLSVILSDTLKNSTIKEAERTENGNKVRDITIVSN